MTKQKKGGPVWVLLFNAAMNKIDLFSKIKALYPEMTNAELNPVLSPSDGTALRKNI
jgi:hypothetical protein